MRISKILISLILSISMLGTMAFNASAKNQMAFDDVNESDWFYNDVKTAYETGLINGKSDTAYAPNDNMTYAEAIKLAACMNQYVTEGEITLKSGDPWYQTYVDYAEDNGIISKSYDYNKNATRSGYMEIFASCLPDENLKEINSIQDNSIPDVPLSAAYSPSVYKLYRAGILTGVDAEHNCNPSANIKRSEVAAILTRMMNEDTRKEFSMVGEATGAPDVTAQPEATAKPDALTITTQPNSVTVNVGADATFTVKATGGKTPYTYKWYYRFSGGSKFFPCTDRAEYYEWFSGVDSDTLTVKQHDSSLEDSEYYCVVTDADGNKVTSDTATLTISTGPLTIIGYPLDATVSTGADATFNVKVAGGKAPYKFQWYRCNADDTYFSRCEDAAEWYERYSITNDGGYTSLTVRKAGEYMKQDGSEYYCVITDANGDAVTSETATLTVKDDIRIDTQPQSFSAAKGKDADFFVSVNGGKAPYKFQWYNCNADYNAFTRCEDAAEWYERYSIDSDGGNYSVLTVRKVDEYMKQDGAMYYCIITDANGNTVTSDTAVLTITD